MSVTALDLTTAMKAFLRGETAGHRSAFDYIHDELHKIARRHLRKERPDHSLNPTALVHEAYVQMIQACNFQPNDRGHFFALAARVMHRLLVDHARYRRAECHGGQLVRVSLDKGDLTHARDLDLLALEEQLQVLAKLSPRQYRLVELRFFAGMKIDEIAALTGLSPALIYRELKAARGWLYTRLK